MKVLAWITEGGWEACVDAAAALDATEVTLLHVTSVDLPGPRGRRHEAVMERMNALAGEAAHALLEDAQDALAAPPSASSRTANRRAWSMPPRPNPTCSSSHVTDVTLVRTRSGIVNGG